MRRYNLLAMVILVLALAGCAILGGPEPTATVPPPTALPTATFPPTNTPLPTDEPTPTTAITEAPTATATTAATATVTPGGPTATATATLTPTTAPTETEDPDRFPTIERTPASGPTGTRVDVTGTNFPADAEVFIFVGPTRDQLYDTAIATTTADADGEIDITITVPETWPNGSAITENRMVIYAEATNAGGFWAFATFTITSE